MIFINNKAFERLVAVVKTNPRVFELAQSVNKVADNDNVTRSVSLIKVLRLEDKLEKQREDGVHYEIALRKEFEDQRKNGHREWKSKLNDFQDIMRGKS
nr:hypothetical protein [Tanacetum cinerariifolium]